MRATVEGVEPRFLTLDEILTLHEVAIAEHGGSAGVRDRAALETCVSQPKQSSGEDYHYSYPHGMSAVYVRQLLQGHPFVDGNKRTALAACSAFLRLNGWELKAEEDDASAALQRFLTDGSDREAIEQWLRWNARHLPHLELRAFMAELDYGQLAEFFQSGLVHEDPSQAHSERTNTIIEAGRVIPAVMQANSGAMHAEQNDDTQSAEVLRAQSLLLCALYRLAENEGYEW